MPAQCHQLALLLIEQRQKSLLHLPHGLEKFFCLLPVAFPQKPVIPGIDLTDFRIDKPPLQLALLQQIRQRLHRKSIRFCLLPVQRLPHPGKQLPEVQRCHRQPIHAHEQQPVQLMVEPVYLLVIKFVIVELGMIVGLHEAAVRKIVDHGRDTGDRNGKIIRPRLYGRADADALRIARR